MPNKLDGGRARVRPCINERVGDAGTNATVRILADVKICKMLSP